MIKHNSLNSNIQYIISLANLALLFRGYKSEETMYSVQRTLQVINVTTIDNKLLYFIKENLLKI